MYVCMQTTMALMKRRISGFVLPVFFACVVVASCAKPSSPTGGPKDKEAPVIIKSEPANGQTNFRGKKIIITFNEYIQLDKIAEKFMVSPPMKKRPEISIKGKSLVIEYDEVLRDSTTYTFYFQDAIRDLNESNPIDNYQFVFSTGDVVDSLSVTGNVLSAFSLDPPENTLVLLYSNLADSAVSKTLPDYITRVTKTGYFRIDNVREGTYRLYALKDNDNSKNFNLPDEDFAYLDTLVKVTSDNYIKPMPDTSGMKMSLKKEADTIVRQGDYRLFLFRHEKTLRYLTGSSRPMKYKLQYTLSLPPDSAGFSFSIPEAEPGSYFTERNISGDTIVVWLTDSSLYSKSQITTIAGYPFTDSTGRNIIRNDTIIMRFVTPRPARGKIRPAPLKVSSSLASGALKPRQRIEFKSPAPFREPDTSRIRLFEVNEKDKTRIPVPYKIKRDSINSCRLFLDSRIVQKKNYLFIADSAAFGNIYGEAADSAGIRFIVRNEDTFNKLKLNINNFEGSRIIQLLNSQDKILREVLMDKDGVTEFDLLDKGRYRLRVIYDLNGDGKWTTGDFMKKRQPEPVSFYPREIDLGENFWADNTWDIKEQNTKKLKNTSGTGTMSRTGR